MKRGDRLTRHGMTATVVDVHPDKVHVSVLQDGGRTLVRWRIPETEALS